MISENLYKFLKEWLEWAEEENKPISSPFEESYGLCTNYYLWRKSVSDRAGESEELKRLFNFDPYPFGEDEYVTYGNNYMQHFCPKRLAWVRQQIKQYEEDL